MQGKLKPIPLWRGTVQNWVAATGGELHDTLELLKARVASSNIRNNVVALALRYTGTIAESGAGAPSFTARQIHRSLGFVDYQDAWAQMVPHLQVDDIVASNFSEGVQSPLKDHTQHGIATMVQAQSYSIDHTIFIAYAPRGLSNKGNKKTKWNGVMAASLLGREAQIDLTGVGAGLAATCVWEAAPVVECYAIVLQSQECPKPCPTQLHKVSVPRTIDPFVMQGELWKIEDLLLLSQTVGTVAVPVILLDWTSLATLDLEFDGVEVLKGRASSLVRAIAAQRNIEGGFAPVNGVYLQDYYQGEAVTLIDSDGMEQLTGGRSGKELELRGQAAIESRHDVWMIQRKRVECPKGLYERWAEKEGLPAQTRKDLRIGGIPAKDAGLTRGEAVGVQELVGSRKNRRTS